jgi:hypothetical protein
VRVARHRLPRARRGAPPPAAKRLGGVTEGKTSGAAGAIRRPRSLVHALPTSPAGGC